MKVYSEELKKFESLKPKKVPVFEPAQRLAIAGSLHKLRTFARTRPSLHFFLQLLPYLIFAASWALLMFALMPALPTLVTKILTLGILHGILGYAFVVYALHEGAGHRLFQGPSLIHRAFRFLAFHSSRLKAADPEFYAAIHRTHHRHLGTAEDLSFTHFVLTKRILRSLLPGAGVFFPNDYKVHHGTQLTRSKMISYFVGIAFLAGELAILTQFMPLQFAALSLILIAPWVGFTLDRIRESIEHQVMASDPVWGSRELGLGFSALLIGGGYSGQSCHFSHHLAPDLNWYQQIQLHRKLKTILTREQKAFIDYDKSGFQILLESIRRQMKA